MMHGQKNFLSFLRRSR